MHWHTVSTSSHLYVVSFLDDVVSLFEKPLILHGKKAIFHHVLYESIYTRAMLAALMSVLLQCFKTCQCDDVNAWNKLSHQAILELKLGLGGTANPQLA